MYPVIVIWYAMSLTAQVAHAALPVDCYIDASNRTSLSQELKVQLCVGSTSAENVDCYIDASNRTSLSQELKVQLCKSFR